MALIISERDASGVVKLTLNDPDNLNAMSEAMAEEFRHVVAQLSSAAAAPRAVVITGAGRAFSAGGDLQMLDRKRSLPARENEQLMMAFYRAFLGIRSIPSPTIAVINGAAIGAGLCLAAACDMRIALRGCKLGFTFVKLGLHPGMGGTYFLPRLIGVAAAAELLMTGRVVEAEEALRIGLVNHLCGAGELEPLVSKITGELAAVGPLALRQLVQSLRGGDPGLEEALRREAQAQAENYASAEFKEGLTAAREKRPPRF